MGLHDSKASSFGLLYPADGKVRRLEIIKYQVEDLAAGADIAARSIFVIPAGYRFTVTAAKVLSQGAPAGIDDSNTCVVAVANGSNNIVSKTYNTGTAFPANGVADSLGALSATYKELAAGAVLKFSVTNGTTADPPGFMLQIEGVLEPLEG